MNFSETLEQLKAGKRAKREAWAVENIPDEMGGNTDYVFLGPYAVIMEATAKGYVQDWFPRPADLMGEDWHLLHD